MASLAKQKSSGDKKLEWAQKGDAVNMLGINLRKEYKNTNMLSSFLDPMGQILSRKATGLSKINQKLVAKAIKRSRSMGFMPYTYRI